jgi:hypothetical protein
MPNNLIIDGALVQWGDRLFYPGNRTVRSPGGVRVSDRRNQATPESA